MQWSDVANAALADLEDVFARADYTLALQEIEFARAPTPTLQFLEKALRLSPSTRIREQDYDELVRLASDPDFDVSSFGNAAIAVAARNFHPRLVELLMRDPKTNPAANMDMALQNAIRFNNFDAVRLLLADSRVNPNNALEVAISPVRSSLEGLKLLMADPRTDPAETVERVEGVIRQNQWPRNAAHFMNVLRLLLDHPRTDWRRFTDLVPEYVVEERRQLRERLRQMLQTLTASRSETQVREPDLIRKIAFDEAYYRLCSDLTTTEIPSAQLVELGRILGLDLLTMNKSRACARVQQVLQRFLGHSQ